MKALSIVTELMVDDMAAMLDFYVVKLGFRCETKTPENNPFFVILENNTVHLMLYAREQFSVEIPHFMDMETGGTTALFLEVEDIEELYKLFKDNEHVIQELHTTNYGTKEFSITDPSGYVIMFNQHEK